VPCSIFDGHSVGGALLTGNTSSTTSMEFLDPGAGDNGSWTEHATEGSMDYSLAPQRGMTKVFT